LRRIIAITAGIPCYASSRTSRFTGPARARRPKPDRFCARAPVQPLVRQPCLGVLCSRRIRRRLVRQAAGSTNARFSPSRATTAQTLRLHLRTPDATATRVPDCLRATRDPIRSRARQLPADARPFRSRHPTAQTAISWPSSQPSPSSLTLRLEHKTDHERTVSQMRRWLPNVKVHRARASPLAEAQVSIARAPVQPLVRQPYVEVNPP
jgi:hypothetical protein